MRRRVAANERRKKEKTFCVKEKGAVDPNSLWTTRSRLEVENQVSPDVKLVRGIGDSGVKPT